MKRILPFLFSFLPFVFAGHGMMPMGAFHYWTLFESATLPSAYSYSTVLYIIGQISLLASVFSVRFIQKILIVSGAVLISGGILVLFDVFGGNIIFTLVMSIPCLWFARQNYLY